MSAQVQQSLVSTIIPVYNRAELIVPSVESVLAQDYRPIEIIIVDDGSSDNTPTVLKKLAAQHSEIQIISQANAGPGAAREVGRIKAAGEFIQYHDSDDLLLPNKFSLQIAALRADPQADVVYGKTQSRTLNSSEVFVCAALKGTGVKRLAMFPLFLRQRWWSTSTPLYRRSVTDIAGPWLETFCEEDWEYDCRIASLGGRLTYVDEFVSITQSHTERLSSGGTTDSTKATHRCLAQQNIFRHACNYMKLKDRPTDIDREDWSIYSKSVFLLSRQCAALGLDEQAKRMFDLSLEALGRKTIQHRLFQFLVSVFGWRGAAQIIVSLGR